MSISTAAKQLTLSLEPGLTQRFRCVRDAVAQGVYQRGLKRTAGDLDMAPGNLSVALADESQRKFGTDEMELYIERTGDLTPVYFLVEKYLSDKTATQDQAMAAVADMLKSIPGMLAAAGLKTAK